MKTQAFEQMRPCLAPGVHKFTVNRPPVGQYGYALIVCERCGMTREEAKR